MLRLKNIVKKYQVADTYVPALKGINLSFRKNEFVSILGPSGCGKTTTLNIIGGLDKYTDGDLFIGGISTKSFKDHDWDVYRNHRVGFIFQAYNLIPHQTILGNVELSLTIAGVSKKERQERAKRALDRVGLEGQYNKKPNQLSGGQCQRVAIARALVNEPDILLADEPTGALDTITSVQIMELIKEISKEKLVIMVTHNPELAEKYSTRIVRLLDGELQEDTNPFSEEDEIKESEAYQLELKKQQELSQEKAKKEKAQMSFWTAFRLSARNLNSKRKRTTMVAFAGCIGIVGVSLVLAVSQGVRGYIGKMQNDMLSGNPVSITSSSINYTSLMNGGLGSKTSTVNPDNKTDGAYVNSLAGILASMGGVTSTNTITKEYMEYLQNMPKENAAFIRYNYGDKIVPNLYTDFETPYAKVNMSISGIKASYQSLLKNVKEYKNFASLLSSVNEMKEMPSDADYIATQYDVVYLENGKSLKDVIGDKSSLVAVVSQSHNTLNDLELAEYGYFSQEQFLNYCYKIGGSDLFDSTKPSLPEKFSYEDIAKKKFTWYPNDSVFYQVDGKETDKTYGAKWYAKAYSDGYLNNETGTEYSDYKYPAMGDAKGKLDLNVKCILKLKSNLSYGCLTAGGLYYTKSLTDYTRDNNKESKIVKSAKASGDALYNIELGYKFKFDSQKTTKESCEHVSLETSTSNAIVNFIAQFVGGSSATQSISAYTTAALGGADYPQSVYFYCNDFNQKEKLTSYLDKWNSNTLGNIYKLDETGFYIQKVKDESTGKDKLLYYYKNPDTNEYYQVNLDEDGLAKAEDGTKYKYFNTSDKTGFYKYTNEEGGDAFNIGDTIDFSGMGFSSTNSYNILNSLLFKNTYTGTTEPTQVSGYDTLYTVTEDDTTQYLLKTQDKNFYTVDLDKEGNVVAKNDNYNKFVLGSNLPTETTDKDGNPVVADRFYSVEYEGNDGTYSKVYKKVARNAQEQQKTGTTWASATQDKIYSSSTATKYANAVKDPEITIGSLSKFTLDTHGYYIDLSKVTDYSMDDFNIDIVNKTISFKDYSKYTFYALEEGDGITPADTYHYVDVEKDGDKYYLKSSNSSTYTSSSQISESIKTRFFSDKYLVNTNGSLSAMTKQYENTATSFDDLVTKKVVGEKLTDTSKLVLDDGKKITYTDSIGLIVGMVTNLIDIITYALVAFTALSLVVSTVMIGIITYVSVVERTKEIGVIRSMGGRKKDVAHLFNAETFIIGLASGVIGILITYGLSAIINLLVGSITKVYSVAVLPAWMAFMMIGLSILLTMLSGLIPARSAANKDPVNALRSE